jgi:hypothetical protein
MVNYYHFSIRGNLAAPLRVQTSAFQASAFQAWALERLISLNCASGDVRWAIMLLALRSVTVVAVFGQRQFLLLVRKVAGRVGREACFAGDITNADTMVAAGGG